MITDVSKPLYGSVDLGGTNLVVSIGDASGQIATRVSEPTRSAEGSSAVIERMIQLLQRSVEQVGCQQLEGIGIGIPGLLDIEQGLTRFLPNFPGNWPDVLVSKPVSEAMNSPVHILNDARMATLGELVFGHGQGCESMVFFGLGTGVGGGVVLDGRLRLGPFGAAGEIGHQTILPDGPLCGCGNRGCLETLASASAMTAEGVRLMLSGQSARLVELTQGNVALMNPAVMGGAAREGDQACLQAITRHANWLGIGAANMVTAIHPELIVIGGGAAALGELIIQPVLETIQSRVGMFPPSDVKVKTSHLKGDAGLLGGIALASRQGIV